ncbi:ABC transporter, ATP-binding protein [Propionibacterium freudenreichii]|nr:ABC transporter, ATP-binding protein [Propionibacterium freudenreichii]
MRGDSVRHSLSRRGGLRVQQLSITRPDGITMVSAADLVFRRGSITLLTGLTGAGTTTLCRALSGSLPVGWRIGGGIQLDGQHGPAVSLRGLSRQDLAAAIGSAIADDIQTQITLRAAGLETVREVMVSRAHARLALARAHRNAADIAANSVIERLGLAELADRPVWGLEQAARWALAAGTAVVGSPAVVVLDSLLGLLDHSTAAGLAGVVTALAAGGSTVIWCEHRLAPVATIADSVVELTGHGAHQSSIGQWHPSAQPRPTLMALVDGLGLDHALWTSPEHINQEISGRARTSLPSAAPKRRTPISPTHPAVQVKAAQLGLQGPPLEFRAGERVGVLCTGPDQARTLEVRLTRALGAPPRTEAESLLRRRPVAQACRAWDELHPGAQTMALLTFLLGPTTRVPVGPLRVPDMSGGQQCAVTTAMALAGAGPAVLADPGPIMDEAMIARLGEYLDSDSPSSRYGVAAPSSRAVVMVGDDPDVISQLCERVVEVRHATIVQDVGVLRALAVSRTRSTLAHACAPLRARQVSEAVAALGAMAPRSVAVVAGPVDEVTLVGSTPTDAPDSRREESLS